MKTVREQMRLSDILLVIDDVSKKASDKGKNKKGDLDPLFQQMAAIAAELSAATISSGSVTGPKGAMELSLADCGIDDETLIGVMSILKDPSKTAAPAPYPGTGPGSSSSSADSSSALCPKATSHPINAASSTLAKSIASVGDYMSRILLLNLKGNCLTDISCKVTHPYVLGHKSSPQDLTQKDFVLFSSMKIFICTSPLSLLSSPPLDSDPFCPCGTLNGP
jgi:hypothetical protein